VETVLGEETQQTFLFVQHLICGAQLQDLNHEVRSPPMKMNQNAQNRNDCEVCHQSFDSAQELQAHRQTAHGQNKPGDRQSDYDMERDQPKRKKIA